MAGALGTALALVAAVCFAFGWVLQQHEASLAPDKLSLRPALLLEYLVRRRIWLLGMLALVVGDGCQAGALVATSLSVVEPLLVTSLLFALPLGAVVARQHLGLREWLGGLAVTGGLVTLLAVGNPGAGVGSGTEGRWLLTVAALGSLVLLLLAGGKRLGGPRRAVLLAAGAATLFGMEDALTKSTFDLLASGWTHALVAWQPYAVLPIGLVGLAISQEAYKAAPLPASLPSLAVCEPLVGSLIGVFVLGAHFQTAGLDRAVEAASALVLIVGSVAVASSPTVTGRRRPPRRCRKGNAGGQPPDEFPGEAGELASTGAPLEADGDALGSGTS